MARGRPSNRRDLTRTPGVRRTVAPMRRIYGPDLAYVEDRAARTLTRRIVLVRDGRRGEELHALRLYERDAVVAWLEASGFDVVVDPSYGAASALPGMWVYIATRVQR